MKKHEKHFFFISGSTKKRPWSHSENVALAKAFAESLEKKENVTAMQIKKAKQEHPELIPRSDANIRTKVNNLIKGKEKNFTKKCNNC